MTVANTMERLCVLFALLLVLILPASGQERFGNISGVATDVSGAVLPDVAITITNKSTNRMVTVTTRGDGNFMAPDLEPGRYSLRFEKSGFSVFEMSDALVLVGRTLKADVQMEVGALAQTVQVVESAPLIDTSTTMIAHNITAEELDRLPKGRTFQGIAIFSPSVNTGEIEGGYQVNGASAAENNYYIDGVSTTSMIDGSARQNATFDYLQEVQVKTNGLEAQYGGALGGVVSAITKSGGNEWHGDAHHYFYGNRVAAAPVKRLQLDPSDVNVWGFVQDKKQKNDNQEIGGSLGGPIVRNKLFVFTSASPRWRRASYDYLFSNGTEPGTMSRDAHYMNWFSKISYDPTSRIRTNFTWLYTPSYLTGSLFAYNGIQPNVSTQSLASARESATRGFNQPEQSYTGNADITVTSTSLLSLKGGRYYLNYKEVGIPNQFFAIWGNSSVGIEGIPAALQQGTGYTTASNSAQTLSDLTTRTYIQADFSQFVNAFGQHTLKVGIGTQKNVNRVNDSWNGPLGRVTIAWGLPFRQQMGKYGYYYVDDGKTQGSTGAHLSHVYFQDAWRIHPRLTLNVGLRMEKETIPSFQRHIQDYAFQFGYGDKIAPRLGASFDVFGNGKLKLSGGWGRYFDWTKYDVARGTFGGEIWHRYYRSLDTLDITSLNLNNMPGQNLWAGGDFRDLRIPGFDLLDQNVKPMSADMLNVGGEYEIRPQMVFSARYSRNKLNRTIEDLGALDANGNEVYAYGNPGESNFTVFPSSTTTCIVKVGEACGFPMPKAQRVYDALEMSLTKRFSTGWLGNISYVYSKLWGNYAGLQATDEIRPPTLPYSSPGNQAFAGQIYRSGGNANRYYDLDEIMWDANGNVGVFGRLPTDRPHVFKFYGARQFRFGTEIGTFFRVQSGTPMSTEVNSLHGIPMLVEGRGNMGRTPVFSQTDLMVAHEVKLSESRRLRFEFNMDNLFNQKTSMFIYNRLNREELYDTVGIDMADADLSKGYNYTAMLAEVQQAVTASGSKTTVLDPRYKQDAIFNPGFQGRFLVKFIF